MKILLTTLHSRYSHSSLALPSLAASLKYMDTIETVIKELTINDSEESLFDALSEAHAEVVAFSCYIWNIGMTLRLTERLKREGGRGAPFIVLGGPEVSFDAEAILLAHPEVDCIVRGEGEYVFKELISALQGKRPLHDIKGITFREVEEIKSTPPAPMVMDLDAFPSPFEAGLADMSKPLVYIETSRGCPFSCAFCLSSIDTKVRLYSIERVKKDLLRLMTEEARTIKFVDRTFNCMAARANEIWGFILANNRESRFHFEIAADLLTESNIEVLKRVPKDTFRFEIGVQSIAEETLQGVRRQSDMKKLFSNLSRLLTETDIVVHLDLVAGLPGEKMAGFLASLERVFQTGSHHIQVEPLKVLKGAPMLEIASREGYRWSQSPPYRIITTPWLSEGDIERIETIGRLLELVYNSGRFKSSLNKLAEMMPLSEFFSGLARFWQAEAISTLPLTTLFETLWQYAAEVLTGEALNRLGDALAFDDCLAGYPTPGRLPPYFRMEGEQTGRVSKGEIATLRNELGMTSGRVRAFTWRFGEAYAETGNEGERDLLFIYHSKPGEKERVEIRSATRDLLPNHRRSGIN